MSLALSEGHRVRALARNPAKLALESPDLEVCRGSVPDLADLDGLLRGADFVVSMLGDLTVQRHSKINTAFVKQLVPAMRRTRVRRLLYQAAA